MVTAHVVLLSPEIPQNTGNIGRTCLAFGAQLHLVRPLGFSLAASALRRAGLDYWEHVQPVVWESWAALAGGLWKLGEPYFFTAEGEHCLFDLRFEGVPVLVFGRESVGLPTELRQEYLSRLVRIPLKPGVVRSLNLASCVAIALAQVYRQRWMEITRGQSGFRRV
ncbi:MAG: tRNA (cytidine(34)-2'-O)-methyltransferase [Thermoanaerobaculum sp.]|nr:tRNA (cytidine(34)-2'-O)-methyltransferase [Thermoanaerobaculum sp.]